MFPARFSPDGVQVPSVSQSVVFASAVSAEADTDACPSAVLRDEFQSGILKGALDRGLIRDSHSKGTFLHLSPAHGRDAYPSRCSYILSGPTEDGPGGAELLTRDRQIIT